MDEQIWVLGATGRSGRGIARRLHETGHHVVLVGRDGDRLADLTAGLSGAEVVAAPFDEQAARLHRAAPRVVVSTVGPFARTAAQVVAALPPGTHYLDLGNEPVGHPGGARPARARPRRRQHPGDRRGVRGGGHRDRGAARRSRPPAARAGAGRRDRVARLPGGVVGEALAGSILDGAPDGGRRVHGGRLVRAAVAGDRQRFSTPSGDTVTTSALPSGEPARGVARDRRTRGRGRDVGPAREPVAASGLPGPRGGAALEPAARGSPSDGWPACRCPSANGPASSRGVEPAPSGTTAAPARSGCGWVTRRRSPRRSPPRSPAACRPAPPHLVRTHRAHCSGRRSRPVSARTSSRSTEIAPAPARAIPRIAPLSRARVARSARPVSRRAVPRRRARAGSNAARPSRRHHTARSPTMATTHAAEHTDHATTRRLTTETKASTKTSEPVHLPRRRRRRDHHGTRRGRQRQGQRRPLQRRPRPAGSSRSSPSATWCRAAWPSRAAATPTTRRATADRCCSSRTASVAWDHSSSRSSSRAS
nr:saccharopine dehydrogenase NADP-binding domain-containing protein [Angustibacter aerolatus]